MYVPCQHFCSLSLQKYVARKARKFEMQGNRLSLPGLKLAYLFHGIAHSPRSVIVGRMLPKINAVFTDLDKYKDQSEKEAVRADIETTTAWPCSLRMFVCDTLRTR